MKPESVNAPEARTSLAALRADLFAVVAFGAILSPALLAVPRIGCVNLHGSLLPDYRITSYNVCYTKLLRVAPTWLVRLDLLIFVIRSRFQ